VGQESEIDKYHLCFAEHLPVPPGLLLLFHFFLLQGLLLLLQGKGAVFMVFGATIILLKGFINFICIFFVFKIKGNKGRVNCWRVGGCAVCFNRIRDFLKVFRGVRFDGV
jgi:hypothetical protein